MAVIVPIFANKLLKRRYLNVSYVEFHTVWLRGMWCTGRNFCTPLVKWSVTVMEQIFTKLVLAQQHFVKNDSAKFHENETYSFFADNRSRADRRTKKCGFAFFYL